MRNYLILIFGLTLFLPVSGQSPKPADSIPRLADTSKVPTVPSDLLQQLDSAKQDRDQLKRNVKEVLANTDKIDKAAAEYIKKVNKRADLADTTGDTVYLSKEVRVPIAAVDSALSRKLRESIAAEPLFKTWWGKLFLHFSHCTWFHQARVLIEKTPQYKVVHRLLKRKR